MPTAGFSLQALTDRSTLAACLELAGLKHQHLAAQLLLVLVVGSFVVVVVGMACHE